MIDTTISNIGILVAFGVLIGIIFRSQIIKMIKAAFIIIIAILAIYGFFSLL